jgi:hypothetical protein
MVRANMSHSIGTNPVSLLHNCQKTVLKTKDFTSRRMIDV